jgi:FkbM family methyltransferase
MLMIKSRIEFFLNSFKNKKKYIENFFKKAGISFAEYTLLKKVPWKKTSILFGNEIKITDPFWHLHSVQELLIDELYQFDSNITSPYIIDCGANVGLSIIYFKKIFPECKILAFEPDPEIFELLKYNIEKFKFKNVSLEKKAVWNSNTVLKFNSTGALGGHIKKEQSENGNLVDVQTIRLKNILEREQIDFLKIDVEGAEKEIIVDIASSLKNVKRIFVEYHRLKDDEFEIGNFISILEDAGFKVFIKEAWNNIPQPFKYKKFDPMFDLQLNIFGVRTN